MISNNIEELREHLSLSKKDLDKQIIKIKSLNSNNISIMQLIELSNVYLDYTETRVAIMITELESNIKNETMPLRKFRIDDGISEEDILKVIKNNRIELCNIACSGVFKAVLLDSFDDIFNDIFDKQISVLNNVDTPDIDLIDDLSDAINYLAKKEQE